MPTFFDTDLKRLLTLPEIPAGAEIRVGASAPPSVGAPTPPSAAPPAPPRAAAPAPRVGAPAPRSPPERGSLFTFIRVDVRHEYCNRTGGACRDLVLRPTPETGRRLAQFGLIARGRPDGIDIVWDGALRDQATDLLAPLLAEAAASLAPAERADFADQLGAQLFEPPLLFTVSLANERFVNFTAMPGDFRIGDPPLLLSTRSAKRQEDEDGRPTSWLNIIWSMRVHRKSIVDSGGMKELATRGRRRIEDPWEPSVVAPAAEEGEAGAPEQGDAAEPETTLTSGVPILSGALAERAWLLTRGQHFALLDLYLVREPGQASEKGRWDGMPIDLHSAPDGGIFRPCSYVLEFKARRTNWRYIVAARSGSLNGQALKVVGPDGDDAGFVAEDALRILPDGRKAICLSSAKPLPILARQGREQAFGLVSTPNDAPDRPRTLIDRLPPAGSESLSPELPPPRAQEAAAPQGRPPYCSDIYVFV